MLFSPMSWGGHLGGVIVWLWLATKAPRGRSAAPRPAGGQRRMERSRQKLVGRDKGSLTEQQTKGTVTAMIPIRRKHKTKQQTAESNSHCPPPPCAPELWLLPAALLPPTRTQHGGTWYGIPCSVWPGGSAWLCLLLVKINPVMAEPRTVCVYRYILLQDFFF